MKIRPQTIFQKVSLTWQLSKAIPLKPEQVTANGDAVYKRIDSENGIFSLPVSEIQNR